MDDATILRRVTALSGGQSGCVSAGQLDAAGIDPRAVSALVRRGELARVLPGVFLVGSRTLTDRQAIVVGLLAAGPGSAASHYTALAMHGLMDPQPDQVWVTAPTRDTDRLCETLVPVASTGRPATIHIVGAPLEPHEVMVMEREGR